MPWSAEVRAAAAVYADETSWYVGGPGYWLWTFTTADATVYHVDHCRGRQVVLDLLGEDFPGMLVSDCLASYEALPYRCTSASAPPESDRRGARPGRHGRREPPEPVETAVHDGHRVVETPPTLGEEDFSRQRGHLEGWLDRLCRRNGFSPVTVRSNSGSASAARWFWGAWTTRRRSRRTTARALAARRGSDREKGFVREQDRRRQARLGATGEPCGHLPATRSRLRLLAGHMPPPGRSGDPHTPHSHCPLNTNTHVMRRLATSRYSPPGHST